MIWLWILLAFALGGTLGIGVMSCFAAAGREDERTERLRMNKS